MLIAFFVVFYACGVIVDILVYYVFFFFFKQKTAYEMRISDWSSDVCSSDLPRPPGEGPSQWVTRERPKIDRIACPWFIRRFVDREALIHYVPKDWDIATAEEIAAIPFDIPDVEFSHNGEACSFDAFITRFGLSDPALLRLAAIVRGADPPRRA